MCSGIGDHVSGLVKGFISGTDMTSRFRHIDPATKQPGAMIYHFMGVSSFSEYTVCNEASVNKINKDAPLDLVAAMSCGVLSGLGVAPNISKILPGSSIGVFGLGAVGMGVIAGAKLAGAGRIFAIDRTDKRFEMAKTFGATDCITSSEDLPKKMAEMLHGGLDYAVECTGVLPVLQQTFDCTHPLWGDTTIIGCQGHDSVMKVNPNAIMFGKKLRGCQLGGWKHRQAVPKLVDDLMAGKLLPMEKMITGRFDFDGLTGAFEQLEKGIGMKSVIQIQK